MGDNYTQYLQGLDDATVVSSPAFTEVDAIIIIEALEFWRAYITSSANAASIDYLDGKISDIIAKVT